MFTANLIYYYLIMRNLQNLKGAKILSKIEQRKINGAGGDECKRNCEEGTCPSGETCHAFSCTKTDGTVVHETNCMPNNGNQ
jgi:hypothetical protein